MNGRYLDQWQISNSWTIIRIKFMQINRKWKHAVDPIKFILNSSRAQILLWISDRHRIADPPTDNPVEPGSSNAQFVVIVLHVKKFFIYIWGLCSIGLSIKKEVFFFVPIRSTFEKYLSLDCMHRINLWKSNIPIW